MKWNRILVIPIIIIAIGVWLLWPSSSKAAPWYNDSWKFRKKLLIDHTKVSGGSNLSNFPVLITRKDMDLASKAQSNGNDILFTDTSGTKLDHEIESYSNGELIAWVEVPTVSPTTDTTIYMYYGNRSAISQVNATGVWDSSYKGVWHVDEGSGTRNDSTTNANNLTATGGPTATTGKIHQANNFVAASNQNLGISNASDVGLDITGKLTIEAWVNTASAGTTQIIASKDGSSGNQGYILRYSSGNRITFLLSPDGTAQTTLNGSTTTLTSGVWYHVAAVYDGTNMNVYLNGTSDGVSAHSTGIFNSTNDFKIGIRSTSTNPFDGNIDEVRVSSTDRSQYWIQTSYNNQSSPATFFTSVGNEEANKGPFAYWKFDEGYGTTAKETINGYNGTLTNGPLWRNESECISGKCLYFDGSNDYVSIDSMTFPAEITISSWIKTTSSAQRPVISNRSSTGYTYFGITGGRAFWYFNGISSPSAISNKYINDNIWHHIVYTHTGDTTYIYIDGVLDNTVTQTGFVAKTDSVRIGHDVANSTEYFPGFIDEPRIYTYARTAAQIKADYAARGSTQGVSAQIGDNGTADQLSNGLVAYYPMDETAANSCTGGTNDTCDRSGNGNDGAWNNGAANGTGKYGNGVSFDGSNDYLEISHSESLDPSTDFTVSTWVKRTGAGTGTNQFFILKNAMYGFTYNNGALQYYDNEYHTATSSTLTQNAWYHLTMVHTTSSVKLFINGVLDSTAATGSPNLSANSVLQLGQLGSSDVFQGALDEVRIYNRALTPAEVSALYEWAPGPLAHWDFDEKIGTSTVNDKSGNNNSMTLTGITSSDWISGKFGNAIQFNGGKYGSIISSIFDNLSQFTWQGWIYHGTSGVTDTFLAKGSSIKDFKIDSSNRLSMTIAASTTNASSISTNTLSANTWYHVTAIYNDNDGVRKIKLYLNGQQVAYTTQTAASGTLSSESGTNLWFATNQSGSEEWFGNLDDIKVYNYTRTTGQIIEDMNGGHPLGGSPIGSQTSYWKFDEGAGSTVYDSSPNRLNGTLGTGNSAPAWTTAGKFNRGLSFDGTNDYINLGDVTALELDLPMTISAWVNIDTLATEKTIISKYYSLTSAREWRFQIDANDKIRFSTSTNGSTDQDAESTTAWTSSDLNTWHHVAATVDAAGNYTFYKNGKPDGNGTFPSTVIFHGTAQAVIGAVNYSGNPFSLPFKGKMDEVKIYNSALTADQIKIDYNRGAAAVMGTTSTASDGITADSSAAREYCVPGDTSTCNPPVAEWKLDEGTGTTGNDTSGNGNAGTLTNGPTWSQGKIGKAVSFDGTDDYVTAGTGFTDSIETSGTISAWVYRTGIGGAIFNRSNGANWTDERLVIPYFRSDTNVWGWSMSNGTNYQNPEWTISTFPANQWTHVSISWNGSTVVTYLNGILFDSRSQSYTPEITGIDTWIGRSQGLGNAYFPGSIDQVRIYNYARSPAQIAWEYNRGAPIAWYKIDECSGTTAYNSALDANGQAAGNNGTITIGASGGNTSAGTCTGSSGEAWKDGATGKINASLEFDGTDDYVSISSITFPTDITISSWVKTSSSAQMPIVSNRSPSGNTYYGMTGGRAFIYHNSASPPDILSTRSINDNAWHHFVYIHRDNTTYFYIDGVLDKTTSQTGYVERTDPVRIAHDVANSTEYFSGSIDDVRIYNYPLTAKQVQLLYSQNAATLFAPLTGSP